MDELVQRLLDDQILPEERARLEKAIREDPVVRQYYVDSLLASAVLRRSSQATGELSESDLIIALTREKSQGRDNRLVRRLYSVAAILILGMAIFASLSVFRHGPTGAPVGVLAVEYEAQWRGARPHAGEPLYAGAYDLREGAAKMELDQGTNLLLEAPCRVELTNGPEVILKRGRLTAVVSSQAKGFRVRTSTALITDLGTEFGVIAHQDQSIEAHVLKGRINVALDPNRSGRSTSLVVNEGQAATVDAAGRTIQDGLAVQADLFLMQVPTSDQLSNASARINLADIVGGGNGRGTGSLNRGIDLRTGQAFNHPPTKIRRVRENAFVLTPKLHGVDGVFVPNGASGPVVISSTGLTFSACPRTVGSYYGGPANSGEFYDLLDEQTYTARLNGVSFGSSRHPALNLHPNAGITFDLNQIRRNHPDLRIERFTAMCGIPKDLPRARFSSADVWILLDGVVSLRLRFPLGSVKVEQVDIPMPAQTRFLTLVATCSGPADYAWIILGDPFLESASDSVADK
jgi:hypothetical protein